MGSPKFDTHIQQCYLQTVEFDSYVNKLRRRPNLELECAQPNNCCIVVTINVGMLTKRIRGVSDRVNEAHSCTGNKYKK